MKLWTIAALLVVAGCSTLTPEEREELKWQRDYEKHARQEYARECREHNGVLYTDRFGNTECVSRASLMDAFGL